jgi:excisionase family DNA binding protein
MSQDKGKLLRVNVAANRLGYSDQHVRRLVRERKIEAVRQSPRKTLIPETAVEFFKGQHEENS